MDRLKQIKEKLMGCVEGQLYGNLEMVDTKELGEVIDMIKDLAETAYYCSITEAMEGKERQKQKEPRYYGEYSYPIYYDDYYEPRYRAPMGQSNMAPRDVKEGRSGVYRKMYMDGKYHGHDKTKQMQELETYMQELAADMTEMIQDASPEEKTMMQQKLTALSQKIK